MRYAIQCFVRAATPKPNLDRRVLSRYLSSKSPRTLVQMIDWLPAMLSVLFICGSADARLAMLCSITPNPSETALKSPTPSAVSRIPRGILSKSCVPSAFSSFCMVRLTLGWETLSSLAALVRFPVLETAKKVFR